MAQQNSNFHTINKLDTYIKLYQAKKSKERDEEVQIKEIMEEIASFSDVSWASIKQIKDKNMQPSLAVAIRISQFFAVGVEDIWKVERIESNVEDNNEVVEEQVEKDVPICNEEGCTKKVQARGLCNKHYQQFRFKNPSLFNKKKHTVCTIDGCENLHYATGLCSKHYNLKYSEKRNRD